MIYLPFSLAYNQGDITPETPVPDYDQSFSESPSPQNFKFARQFSKVLSSIKSIGIQCILSYK